MVCLAVILAEPSTWFRIEDLRAATCGIGKLAAAGYGLCDVSLFGCTTTNLRTIRDRHLSTSPCYVSCIYYLRLSPACRTCLRQLLAKPGFGPPQRHLRRSPIHAVPPIPPTSLHTARIHIHSRSRHLTHHALHPSHVSPGQLWNRSSSAKCCS